MGHLRGWTTLGHQPNVKDNYDTDSETKKERKKIYHVYFVLVM